MRGFILGFDRDKHFVVDEFENVEISDDIGRKDNDARIFDEKGFIDGFERGRKELFALAFLGFGFLFLLVGLGLGIFLVEL